ncbi:MAG: CPBP family glutamic-type intramembrane protease [Flavobacteriales bacterium]
MNNGSYRDFHPLGKVVMFFILCLAGLVLFSLLSLGLVVLLGEEIDSLLSLRIQTLGGQIGAFLIPALVFVKLYGLSSVKGFLMNPPKTSHVLATLVLATVAMAFIGYLGELNVKALEGKGGIIEFFRELEDQAADTIEIMLNMETIPALLINVFLIAVVPAVCEELAFRGVLQSQLAQAFQNTHLAIWISAFIFSAIHFQFFGFLPRLVLGAIFGYLMVYSGSIWPAITAHFINNALGVLGYYLAQNTDLLTQEQVESGEVEWYLALASLILVLAIVAYIKRSSNWPGIEPHYLSVERAQPS